MSRGHRLTLVLFQENHMTSFLVFMTPNKKLHNNQVKEYYIILHYFSQFKREQRSLNPEKVLRMYEICKISCTSPQRRSLFV